ncbi:hypothetical protein [Nakamurella sp. PAMC28650]|uniref:hypothetical protein n=1 Tax=Nakamurella sp. PAMC28650 TaxID=2762325 RepID=UPI00164D8600|nr:hypothetical protein [Nakamurella sp. PAMC28650]QNK82562.1 hypothetical protein H7F38_07610 [Nakamurella sp. PAMC28650]
MSFGVAVLIALGIGMAGGGYIRWRISVGRQYTVPGAKSAHKWRKRQIDVQHAKQRQDIEERHRQAEEELTRLLEEAKKRIQHNM